MVCVGRHLAGLGMGLGGCVLLLHDHRHSVWSGVFSHCRIRVLPVRANCRGERECGRLHVFVECDLGDLRGDLALAQLGDQRHLLLLHNHRHSVWHWLFPHCEGELRPARKEGRVAVRRVG